MSSHAYAPQLVTRWLCCMQQLLLLLSLLLLQLSATTLAHPYRAGVGYIDPQCTDAETGRQLYVGDAFTRAGQCVRVQCLGTLQLWEDRCQVPKLQGNCTRVPAANEYLDYPHCCPMYACKTYATNDIGETEETRTYDQYGTLRKTYITQVFVISDPQKGNIPGAGVKTQFEI